MNAAVLQHFPRHLEWLKIDALHVCDTRFQRKMIPGPPNEPKRGRSPWPHNACVEKGAAHSAARCAGTQPVFHIFYPQDKPGGGFIPFPFLKNPQAPSFPKSRSRLRATCQLRNEDRMTKGFQPDSKPDRKPDRRFHPKQTEHAGDSTPRMQPRYY